MLPHPFGRIFLTAACALGGCSAPRDDDRAPPTPPRAEPQGPPSEPARADSPGSEAYAGPPVRGELETMESQPPQYAVTVETTVPTGGYQMALDGVAWHGEVADVEVRITLPGEGEVVTQAVETHRVRAVLPRKPRSCRVLVAIWTRGVHYLVAPEHVLAAVVPAAGQGTGR